MRAGRGFAAAELLLWGGGVRRECLCSSCWWAVVRKRRRLQREDRHQPVVSLIGYTNAGKSSLLNRLTRTESVAARDRPFETLDTTVRSLYLPPLGQSVPAHAHFHLLQACPLSPSVVLAANP